MAPSGRILRAAIGLVFTLCSFANAQTATSPDSGLFELVFNQLTHLTADPSNVSHVRNVVIRRDVADFYLDEGDLCLCQKTGDEPHAAVFSGRGRFVFLPPTDIEQEQLYRFFEKKSLDEKLNFVVLLFADSTLAELKRNVSFSPGSIPSDVPRALDAFREYMGEADRQEYDEEIAKTFLENRHNDLFYAHIGVEKNGPLFFEINPYDDEEISLMRRTEGHGWEHQKEVINQFPPGLANLKHFATPAHNKEFIHIDDIKIDLTVKDDLKIRAVSDLSFRPTMRDQHWIYLYLHDGLQVDSVLWGNNSPAHFFRGKDNPVLWIHSNRSLAETAAYALRIFYGGELFYRDQVLGWITLRSPDLWYPRSLSLLHATNDVTFHTPSRYKLAGSGENTAVAKDDDVTTSHWISRSPTSGPSFALGSFKEFDVGGNDTPPVSIFVADFGHEKIATALAPAGILSGRNMEEEVGSDVVNSILLFQNVYGRIPVKRFMAAEIPQPHGEAFPGLIHLSWATFQFRDMEGGDQIFRAHEVAHQWWGIGVNFRTYHDQWLSEGFAEFSGLWYLQTALHDNDKYFGALDKWKKQILSNRKYLFGSGQEAGPIWLGRRTRSSSTKGDYDLIIYKKGAWALHMLRNMMLDLTTMNEDRFKAMMREFYSSYESKSASTEDFQALAEKHLGATLDWFFKEWIYETGIPTYKVGYRIAGTPDGKFKVSMKVFQLNVKQDFLMIVPIKVDFGDKKFVRLRTVIKGPVSEFDLPLLPLKPEKIIFNDLQSVLCEVEYVDWDHRER